jgi:hypothetical protein
MTTTDQKHQILESLDYLNQAQADKVLGYIHGLLSSTHEQARYKRQKTEAMKEIRQALSKGKGRKLNPAF